MDKLYNVPHMMGDTVTPRHYNVLVDLLNAMAAIINAQADIITDLNTKVQQLWEGDDE